MPLACFDRQLVRKTGLILTKLLDHEAAHLLRLVYIAVLRLYPGDDSGPPALRHAVLLRLLHRRLRLEPRANHGWHCLRHNRHPAHRRIADPPLQSTQSHHLWGCDVCPGAQLFRDDEWQPGFLLPDLVHSEDRQPLLGPDSQSGHSLPVVLQKTGTTFGSPASSV